MGSAANSVKCRSGAGLDAGDEKPGLPGITIVRGGEQTGNPPQGVP
jgi:hypothetical protein